MRNLIMGISVLLAGLVWAGRAGATDFVYTPAVEIEVRDAVSSEPVKGAMVVTVWRKWAVFSWHGTDRSYTQDVRLTDENGRARIPRNMHFFPLSVYRGQLTWIIDPYREVIQIGMSRYDKDEMRRELIRKKNGSSKVKDFVDLYKWQNVIKVSLKMMQLKDKYRDSVRAVTPKANDMYFNDFSMIIGYWRIGNGRNVSLGQEVDDMINNIAVRPFNYFVWAKKHKLPVNLEDVFRVWRETDKTNFIDVYFSEIREAVGKVR